MEFARGASTITQQLAKNLYLSPSKNPIRKVRELLIARRLEAELIEAAHPRDLPERRRVGQRHLRRRRGGAHLLRQVRGGSRAAGIGAAGGCDHQPESVDPARPSPRLRRRQEMILRRMGAVTPPPVVAEPHAPSATPESDAPPSLPPPAESPLVLPGEVVPPAKVPLPEPSRPGPRKRIATRP